MGPLQSYLDFSLSQWVTPNMAHQDGPTTSMSHVGNCMQEWYLSYSSRASNDSHVWIWAHRIRDQSGQKIVTNVSINTAARQWKCNASYYVIQLCTPLCSFLNVVALYFSSIASVIWSHIFYLSWMLLK